MHQPRAAQIAGLAFLWGGLGLGISGGCSSPCCEFDERPTPLERASSGELLIGATVDGESAPRKAMLELGSPISVFGVETPTRPVTARVRTVTLFAPGSPPAARVRRHEVRVYETTLAPVGIPEAPIQLGALLGADLFTDTSVEVDFSVPTLTFFTRQPAPSWFLSANGYAVLHLPRFGGGTIESHDPGILLGKDAPRSFSPARLVMRACAAPAGITPGGETPICCAGQERARSSGTDLALLLSTASGPLILSRAAWEKIRSRKDLGAAVEEAQPGRSLLLPFSGMQVAASWGKLPRLALVDQESGDLTDPGPCAELARARRLEYAAATQVRLPDRSACPAACDRDPSQPELALNSAGYVELGGALDVAVVADAEPILQGIRSEIRPEGPEIDGWIGADALRALRLEIDTRSTKSRAIFTCASAADPRCRAVGRCPRFPGPGTAKRSCFGLPPHALPAMCETPKSSCSP